MCQCAHAMFTRLPSPFGVGEFCILCIISVFSYYPSEVIIHIQGTFGESLVQEWAIIGLRGPRREFWQAVTDWDSTPLPQQITETP